MPDREPTEKERIAREAQAFAESIVDTVREPLVVLDKSLRVVVANRSFHQTFGVSPEETLGRRIYELGNGQWNLPELRRLLEEILPDHTHFDDLEIEHAFPVIGTRTMLLNARRLYRPGNNTTMILLAIEDVTERRGAERAAQASRELLATTLRSIGDAVLATDGQGRLTFMNPVAEQLTGWSETEALGKDHAAVFHIVSEATREPAESPVDRAIRSGIVSGLANHTLLLARDGRAIPISDSGAPIRDERGDLVGAVLVFRDIAGQRAREARLEAAYERERRIAEALQRPLTLEVPENAFPGLSVATLYEAALEEAQIGGDFFDVFALPRGRVAVAIADASGKGLSAAARALQLKDVLRAFTREYPHSPAAIVARLNDFVYDTRHFDEPGDVSFSCLSLAILDPETGSGALVVAGCEPALILRASGAAEPQGARGLPLGIEREELYAATPFHLAPGDTLLLVTDGITEARRGNDLLGYEGMTELAKAALRQDPPSLREAAMVIRNGAHAFGGGLRDDACLVLVRRVLG
jgi:PAS domain S-box-containing protein